MVESIALWVLALVSAPLFAGVILKVKAFFGGRKGSPVLIHYYTLQKLFRKGSVYSHSTTFMFRLGPVISLAVAATTLFFLPMAGHRPVISFNGDVIFVLYILGLSRFFTICAAMDTASPFEGMGAAREAYFPIICEASMFMILILFYRLTHLLSFDGYLSGENPLILWKTAGPILIFVVMSLFIILLTENSRVPVDDPATHLELTMIHEVMVLDHSGPDLGLIELGSVLKLFFYSAIIARLIFPFETGVLVLNLILFYTGILVVTTVIGVVESVMARYRMDRVPKFLLTAFSLAFFATIITLEFLR
ncbi:NADH-quinone oxidoreductase subunit H [Desulfosarcina sp. OttesenSCG-928-A07]|nr:NADH-quinone oxidoreductase subunit H [Desulfosarcina sp. OttesenSCG-928-A07]